MLTGMKRGSLEGTGRKNTLLYIRVGAKRNKEGRRKEEGKRKKERKKKKEKGAGQFPDNVSESREIDF